MTGRLCELQNSYLVMKPAMHPKDIGVAEAGLNLYLPPQLGLNIVVLKLVLE